MYLVDFFKRLGRKSNIPVIIYLVLNVVIIGFITHLMIGAMNEWHWALSFLFGIGLYLISLVIALSPIGEWILRYQTHCKPIEDEQIKAFIYPIFAEVYARARKLDPTIPKDVRLYISDDPSPNAFATGRKTICITKGLLEMTPEHIKATLGHEFGHLAHKDTDLILVVSVGNMIVTAMIFIIRIIIEITNLIFSIVALFFGGDEGVFAAIISAIYHAMLSLVISGLMWLWSKIGVLLVMKSSRSNEFEADAFSFRLGYGNALCSLLDIIGGSSAKGLFANLASSHPGKEARISKLRVLGATYVSPYAHNYNR